MMKHTLYRSFLPCLAILFGICTASAQTGSAVLPSDSTEIILRAASKQATAFRANFTYASWAGPQRQEMATVDIRGERVDEIEMWPGDKQLIYRWIFDGKETWSGLMRLPGNLIVPGSWQMQKYPEGVHVAAPAPKDSDYGIDILKKALIPVHLLDNKTFDIPSDFKITATDRKQPADGHIIRTYRVEKDGQSFGELEYELDLSDGLKIISTSETGTADGQQVPALLLKSSDFKKIGGVWLPFEIQETTYEAGSSKPVLRQIHVHWAEINPILSDDAFRFVATQGSLIWDVKTSRYAFVKFPTDDQPPAPR